jgi:hypothetical protein
MKRVLVALLILGSTAAVAHGDEKVLADRITSLGLFKNGLAFVERVAEAPEAGTWRLENLPVPVHGTFWVESDAKVAVRMTQQLMDVPAGEALGVDFQDGLAGREVVVHFSDGQIPPATGTVLDVVKPDGSRDWSRAYEQPQYRYGSHMPYGIPNNAGPGEPMLVLKTGEGLSYIKRSMIAYLQVKGAPETVRARRPVMLLIVDAGGTKPAKVVIRYLTKGMAWAPSYSVDITDPKTLRLRQEAVIKNELEPIRNAEIRLISGFPSIRFANVTSPLSLGTSWSRFFQELNTQYSESHPSMSNRVMQQQVSFGTAAPDGMDLSAPPAGEGVDLHYQSIGRQTLDEGDSLVLETGRSQAEYERLVEWIVPDTRDAYGRQRQEVHNEPDAETFQDALWDAVRFRNPFPFSMTTAPAMVIAGDQFNGQQMSYWTSVGEQTTLRVTKALNVRAHSIEHEVEGNREIVYLGGWQFQKTVVEGVLRASNHRREPIKIVIRRRFSGDLISADGEPEKTLLEEGAWSINKRNQLTWTRQLQPGEEVGYKYRYTAGLPRCKSARFSEVLSISGGF